MASTSTARAGGSSLDHDAGAFYDALSELIRVYQFRDRDRICCHDVSVTQCYALEALVRGGPLTLNELAAHLYLDKSTASRVVGAMERKGLVRRRKHARDRRAVMLESSAAGRRLYETIRDEIEEREKRLLSEFEPEVRGAMIELLRRLGDVARERVDTSGGTCCSIES